MTQTSQHTPGPWEFSYVPGEYGHVITTSEGEIAEAFSEAFGEDQAIANARLIAAAPDLLETLEAQTEAAQAVIDAWSQGDLAGAVRMLHALLPEARVVVAAAKGGAS